LTSPHLYLLLICTPDPMWSAIQFWTPDLGWCLDGVLVRWWCAGDEMVLRRCSCKSEPNTHKQLHTNTQSHHKHTTHRTTAPTSTRASPTAGSCRSTWTECPSATAWTSMDPLVTSPTRSPASSATWGRTCKSSTLWLSPAARASRPLCRYVRSCLIRALIREGSAAGGLSV
jgi:hypothetical protein